MLKPHVVICLVQPRLKHAAQSKHLSSPKRELGMIPLIYGKPKHLFVYVYGLKNDQSPLHMSTRGESVHMLNRKHVESQVKNSTTHSKIYSYRP